MKSSQANFVSAASRNLVVALIALAALVAAPPGARAVTYVVNTLSDDPLDPGMTLREAIAASNADAAAEPDLITFSVAGPITVVDGSSLVINNNNNVTIQGPAPVGVGVTAVGVGRVLVVTTGCVAVIQNLTIAGGTGTGSGGMGGGGVLNLGSLTLRACTLRNNNAGGDGGAIGNSGTLVLENTTISENTANFGSGGAIFSTGSLTLDSCTITLNSANANGGVVASSGTANVRNTIIAGNTGPGTTPSNVAGAFTSQGFNLIGNPGTATGFMNGVMNDQVGTDGAPLDPMVGPIANNGGPTPTHALLPGSPALEAGDTTLAVDQRGIPRPVDADGTGGAQDDIGSVEDNSAILCMSLPPVTVLNLFGDARNKISATQGATDPLGMASGLLPMPGKSSDFPAALAIMTDGGPNGMLLVAASSRKQQAVWVMLVDPLTGIALGQAQFAATGPAASSGGFPSGLVIAGDSFGTSLAWLGMLDPATAVLAVGAPADDQGGFNRGGVWLVPVDVSFSDPLQVVPSGMTPVLIGDGLNGLPSGSLLNGAGFGWSLSTFDENEDGTVDWLAVGAPNRVLPSQPAGSVWILGLDAGRNVTSAARVAPPDQAEYGANLGRFGDSVAWMGDIDDNAGTVELVVGAPQHRGVLGGRVQAGVVWVLSLSDLAMGTLEPGASVRVGSSLGQGGFPAQLLGQADFFGQSLAALGDLDGDGHHEIAVGAPGDDDGLNLMGAPASVANQGAVWVLSLDPCSRMVSRIQYKVTEATADLSGFPSPSAQLGLDASDYFGWSLAALPSDGGIISRGVGVGGIQAGLAVGAFYDDDGGTNRGAIWMLNIQEGAPRPQRAPESTKNRDLLQGIEEGL